MARQALGGRTTCESCTSIDVRQWHRQGRLYPGQQFAWSWRCGGQSAGSISVRVESAAVVLSYRSSSSGSNEWKSIQQKVPISLTACHLGGVRPWFICSVYCNGRYCGRRAAILYGAGELFACRQCYGLAYASQQQTPLHRGLHKARKIRMRLGGSADLSRSRQGQRVCTGRRFSGCGPARKRHYLAPIPQLADCRHCTDTDRSPRH